MEKKRYEKSKNDNKAKNSKTCKPVIDNVESNMHKPVIGLPKV